MVVVELKLLSREGIPSALAKGERYRLLGQAWDAEKIYLRVAFRKLTIRACLDDDRKT